MSLYEKIVKGEEKVSLVGLGSFGLVGGLIKKFAIFMFGSWNALFLKNFPKFFKKHFYKC